MYNKKKRTTDINWTNSRMIPNTIAATDKPLVRQRPFGDYENLFEKPH